MPVVVQNELIWNLWQQRNDGISKFVITPTRDLLMRGFVS